MSTARPTLAPGFALTLSMALAIAVGFLDIAVAILSGRSIFISFRAIPPAAAATILFVLTLYLALWFGLLSHAGRLLGLRARPLAVALAAFVGLVLLLGFIHGTAYDVARGSLTIKGLVEQAMLAAVALLIAVGVYRTIGDPSLGRDGVLPRMMLAVPFVLVELALLAWLHRRAFDLRVAAVPLLAVLGYGVLMIGTFAVLWRLAPRLRVGPALAGVLMLSLLAPLAAWVGAGSGGSSFQGPSTRRPVRRVMLISIDTLRADFLSWYNPQGPATPNIDRLAEEGVRFSRAYSPSSWTLPAFASIFTGLSPLTHATLTRNSRLPDGLTTLAELLDSAGYHTAAIGANFFLTENFNLTQGFAQYRFFPLLTGTTFGTLLLGRLSETIYNPFLPAGSTRDLTRLAVEWIDRNAGSDFFFWLHYFDPHLPYDPPDEFQPEGDPPAGIGREFSRLEAVRGGYAARTESEREWIRQLYAGEVRYVDANVGRVLDTLRRLGLYDDTLIILLSDHGEEFWEHDGFEHGHRLYDEVLRVPLIIKPPAMAGPPQRIDSPVSTESVLPTVLELCGIEYDPQLLSGTSLVPLWTASDVTGDPAPILSSGTLYYEQRDALVAGDLKYIVSVGGVEELYDLADDPGERTSLVAGSTGRLERARGMFEQARRRMELLRTVAGEQTELAPEEIEQLRSLGYVD